MAWRCHGGSFLSQLHSFHIEADEVDERLVSSLLALGILLGEPLDILVILLDHIDEFLVQPRLSEGDAHLRQLLVGLLYELLVHLGLRDCRKAIGKGLVGHGQTTPDCDLNKTTSRMLCAALIVLADWDTDVRFSLKCQIRFRHRHSLLT